MSPSGPVHAALVDRLNRMVVQLAGPDVVVRVQNPILIGSYSEPEPDLVLAWPRDDGFLLGHPRPEDVALLVEVADSSLPAGALRHVRGSSAQPTPRRACGNTGPERDVEWEVPSDPLLRWPEGHGAYEPVKGVTPTAMHAAARRRLRRQRLRSG